MTQPLVIGYHLVWTAYGWWLPNDPRGSGSTEVHSQLIAELGEIHYGRKAVQPPRGEIRRFQERGAQILKYPRQLFDEAEREQIAAAFARVIDDRRYTCYACAIMPDHVHILIRKHRDEAEEMAEALRQASRDEFRAAGRRAPDHPIWTSGNTWKGFVDHPDKMRRVIDYIERNPVQIGLPEQHWPFVKPYDGWPLHPGHSPDSPYARRLRQAGRYP